MDNLETAKLKTLNAFVLTAASYVCAGLSDVIGKRIETPFVRADVIDLDHLEESVSEPDALVSASILPMHGEVVGVGAFIANLDSAVRLTEIITGRQSGSTTKLDELSISALMEISNIVGGMFLSKLSPKSGFRFVQAPPEHRITTMKKAIKEMGDAIKQNKNGMDKTLIIDFSMSIQPDGEPVSAHYFFLLDESFLNYILETGFTQSK